MKMIRILPILMFLVLQGISAQEFKANDNLNYAQVESVQAVLQSNGTWTISATLRHNDQGWDHYADQWIVVDPETEKVLGTRVLTHPHVEEQPFTRSLTRLILPKGQRYLEIRAKCTLHGYEGKRVLVDLTQKNGPGYSIKTP
ncbi:hypothetical protein EXM22_00055 [Oceanispirochaeta crateris]|uniref:Desulfoferrodoxin ferrous iron-binding domain-containing protein n=1 Tax=Oceanispirochaeta crateris TaxID=2518645 RepID=A0A5C1QGH4_9SPIO|nr:hypothetical protein [Oceanispirochaeta crateris]QEN06458.1 hypothetical protein EXM22_00055 [Oceanispirochaeta crateris]